MDPVASRTESTPLSSATGGQLTKICPSCQNRYPGDFLVCPRDATQLATIPAEEYDPLIGALMGETFQIARLIGEGGMARVYEAHHVRLPTRRVAVKVLHNEYARQPDVVARFRREAEAASGIGHPNVVDVFDVGQTPDGAPYLVSELLDGIDFSVLLDRQGSLDPGAAVNIVRQVCRALAAAHDAGVVHRDVKPENVFLVGDPLAPIVKVIDFGISKFDGGGSASLTQTGMIMGTPGYMPPEQARGAKADHRADIYGVGAMLYHAVTGQLPFDADNPSEVLGKVLTEEPPRPRSLARGLPEALEIVIQRAMAKDPADRYQAMTELDEALAPFDPEMSVSVSLYPPAPVSGARSHSTAPTVLSPRLRTTTGLELAERATREAKIARPTLVVLSLVAYAWTTGCVIELARAIFRALGRGGTPLAAAEELGITVVVGAFSVTPVIFWVRHLMSIWTNSMRAVRIAEMLRRLTLWATTPYAFASLIVHLAGDALWGTLGILLPPGASLLSAISMYLLTVGVGNRARATASTLRSRSN